MAWMARGMVMLKMSPDRWSLGVGSLLLLAVAAPARSQQGAPAPGDVPPVRVANAEATARARKFLDFGDARFREQKFSEAYQHYRKAADAAPNLPDAYFRQALVQVALGRYAPAMKSVRRAALLDPEWPNSIVRLRLLYGDNRAAKQMHLEQLATAAENDLDNKDLMFLLAIELFCDDQQARAMIFFKRADQLGIDPNLVKAFLNASPKETGAQDL